MAVDLRAIADQGIASLQTAIDKLNALKAQPGADIPAIVAQVEQLQQKQAGLRTQQLEQVEEDPSNAAAIAAVNAAAGNLKAEAGNIALVASALNTASKVLGYATDLAKALAAVA